MCLASHRKKGRTIGLVPTMGALHLGHLSLVQRASAHVDVVLVSIFVNPTQFNNPEDLQKYPRTLEDDLGLLEKEKVDYVFLPDEGEMYPERTLLKFDFGILENTLEGAFRRGHFNGVGVVVSKLFHIIEPDYAYFGQKDLQQVAIIRCLVKDLFFDIQLVIVPTIRESDGLAMSSRNARLNQSERNAASLLYESLSLAKDELLQGGNWLEVKEMINRRFDQEPLARLEYFELVETDTMKILSGTESDGAVDLQGCSLCTAAFIGEVRLIDNLPI